MHNDIKTPKYGVVIPARNEAHSILNCLRSLEPFRLEGDALLVVDDGSSDETVALVQGTGIKVLRSEKPSRGRAVALGVAALFQHYPNIQAILIAHADMRFSCRSREKMMQALQQYSTASGGAFGHRIDHPHWIYRRLEWGNNLRACKWGLPYGDQAQFFRPVILDKAGGFPQQNSMEDLELALRLRTLGPVLYLNEPVLITARHWEQGVVKTTLRNWIKLASYLWIRRLHRASKDPDSVGVG